jgi:hypothetical protein
MIRWAVHDPLGGPPVCLFRAALNRMVFIFFAAIRYDERSA